MSLEKNQNMVEAKERQTEEKEENENEKEKESSSENEKSSPKKISLSKVSLKPLSRKDFSLNIINNWINIQAKNPPSRRSNHTSFIYKEKYLYIIGGADITERKQNDIFRINLLSNNPKWKKIDLVDSTLDKIAYHAGVLYNNIYYIIGGQNDKMRSLNVILKFNVDENKIIGKIEPDKKDFPSLESHSANLYKQQIIIYGGNKGKFFNKHVYSFNIETEEIVNLTEYLNDNVDLSKMPLPRADHSTEIIGDNLYVFGGYGRKTITFNGFFNDLWCFNLTNNTWNQIKFGDEDNEEEEEEEEDEEEEEEEREENEKNEENEEKKEKEEKEEKKEKEKKNKIDKPKGRSGQNMINVNGKLYIFGGKLGVIQESNELWILDPSIPKYELVHDTLIEKYTTEEIKTIYISSEKKKKKFHWLTKREVDERTNPLPFALKKSKTTKKLKNNKKDGNRGKLNNSFTEYKTKYSDQVLNRINVRTMKHGLIYNSIYDKLIKANETLKQNEKAMIDKDNNFIIGNVPEPRDGQSCNLFQNNKLVFFGGDRNKFPFNDLYFFDIEGNVLVDYESMYNNENKEFDN